MAPHPITATDHNVNKPPHPGPSTILFAIPTPISGLSGLQFPPYHPHSPANPYSLIPLLPYPLFPAYRAHQYPLVLPIRTSSLPIMDLIPCAEYAE